MTILKLADIIIPGSAAGQEVAGFIQKRTQQKSAFVRSGIATAENDDLVRYTLALEKGGYSVTLNHRNPLSGAEQIMNDTKDLVINKISYGQDVAAVFERANSWGVTDLAVDLSGDDPIDDMVDQLADYWAERDQIQLINTLNGIFGSASMSANVFDISAEVGDDGIISNNSFIAASRKLGDRSGKLVAVAMHSAVMTTLMQQDLIEFVPSSVQGEVIPRYMGKDVIEDDGLPYDSGTDVASMYLFGRGAIAHQQGTPKNAFELDRASLTNGGQDWFVSRRKYIMHPRGVKWNTAATLVDPTPNNAELATPANWTRVYDPKEIPIVEFTFRLA